jgi:hypothetical protein
VRCPGDEYRYWFDRFGPSGTYRTTLAPGASAVLRCMGCNFRGGCTASNFVLLRLRVEPAVLEARSSESRGRARAGDRHNGGACESGGVGCDLGRTPAGQ